MAVLIQAGPGGGVDVPAVKAVLHAQGLERCVFFPRLSHSAIVAASDGLLELSVSKVIIPTGFIVVLGGIVCVLNSLPLIQCFVKSVD